jgi:ParB family transcriptional regulator, chromosome partitioning protein
MGAEVSEAVVGVERPPARALAVAGYQRARQRAAVAVVPVAAIRRNPEQPRKTFDAERLSELSVSIRERGLLQPVILRREEDGGYLLMAGERRLRAAELAGVESVPALIREDDPLEVGLIENLQREDLAPLEEAEALNGLVERRAYTHKALADLLGKSRPYISNTLALVRLPMDLKKEILESGVEVSRELLIALARQPSQEAQAALWSRIKLSQLSVRTYREGTGDAGENPRPKRSAAAELLRSARRFNRSLKLLDWAEVSGEDRPRVHRALARIERRVASVLTAAPE